MLACEDDMGPNAPLLLGDAVDLVVGGVVEDHLAAQ